MLRRVGWGAGESGENKTVPQHPPSHERAWTKDVLETATNETQLFHAVVRAGGLYLIEGIGDCNE